ncbi:MAG: KR domain-containing protein [bacterium]|nr:KR domain-containing protein [bacterium]
MAAKKSAEMAALEQVLDGKNLDFCQFTSSLSTVLGGLGYTAFAAAHHYMDSYVSKHNRNHSRQWRTIDWDGWRLKGDEPEKKQMEPEEGEQVFRRIVETGEEERVVVSVLELQTRLQQWVSGERSVDDSGKETKKIEERPEVSTPYVAPAEPIEQELTGIWSRLLGFAKPGVVDDFFELGGDSLKATELAAKIHGELDVKIHIAEIFENPTIRTQARCIGNRDTEKYQSIRPVEAREYYPLTPQQMRLYVQHKAEPQSMAYNVPAIFEMEGESKIEKVEAVFKQLIKRHESLRTQFEEHDGKPVQKILPDVPFQLETYDRTEGVQEIMQRFIRPFHQEKAPLLRVGIIEGEPNYLMIDMMHIVSDAVSLDNLSREFMKLYEGRELPPLKIRPRDYAIWLERNRGGGALAKQEAFWIKQFEGEKPEVELPLDYERPAKRDYEGEKEEFRLSREETAAIKEMAVKEDVTLFMILTAIYEIWMSKLYGTADIVVGTVAAGRTHADLGGVIGMFVNTLAMRSRPTGSKTFTTYLKEVRERTLQVFDNQDYPFEELVKRVVTDRDPARNPLFDVTFVLQSAKIAKIEIPGLRLKPLETGESKSLFDISLDAMDEEDGLHYIIRYRNKLFKRETIQRFVTYYEEVLASVLNEPLIKLKDIQLTHNLEESEGEVPDFELQF